MKMHVVPSLVLRAWRGPCGARNCHSNPTITENTYQRARPEGFEPPTPGFEVRCSIQLSYGRLKPNVEECITNVLARS